MDFLLRTILAFMFLSFVPEILCRSTFSLKGVDGYMFYADVTPSGQQIYAATSINGTAAINFYLLSGTSYVFSATYTYSAETLLKYSFSEVICGYIWAYDTGSQVRIFNIGGVFAGLIDVYDVVCIQTLSSQNLVIYSNNAGEIRTINSINLLTASSSVVISFNTPISLSFDLTSTQRKIVVVTSANNSIFLYNTTNWLLSSSAVLSSPKVGHSFVKIAGGDLFAMCTTMSGSIRLLDLTNGFTEMFHAQTGLLPFVGVFYEKTAQNLIGFTQYPMNLVVFDLFTNSLYTHQSAILGNLVNPRSIGNRKGSLTFSVTPSNISYSVIATINAYVLPNCTNAQFLNQVNATTCIACPLTCLTCYNSSYCITCPVSLVWMLSWCCESTQFNSGGVCINCPTLCLTCTSSLVCTSCINDFYQLNEGSCFPSYYNGSDLNGLLNILKKLISVPGSRKILKPIFGYFVTFDDLQLFYYHQRVYTNIIVEFFQQIRSFQIQKWQLVHLNDALNLIGVNLSTISNKLDFKFPYFHSNFTIIQNKSENLLVNSLQYFMITFQLTILSFIGLYILFRILFSYRISSILRKYCLVGLLVAMLTEGNIQYFTFLIISDFLSMFSFEFSNKLTSIFTIMSGFLILVFSFSGFLQFYVFYRKLNLYLAQNYRNSFFGSLFQTVQRGGRNIILAVLHNILRPVYSIQIFTIMGFEIVWTSLIIMSLTDSAVFRSKLSAWILVCFSFLRILLELTFFIYQSGSSINTAPLESAQLTLLILILSLFLFGIVHDVLRSFVIQVKRHTENLCNAEQAKDKQQVKSKKKVNWKPKRKKVGLNYRLNKKIKNSQRKSPKTNLKIVLLKSQIPNNRLQAAPSKFQISIKQAK